MSPRGIGVHPLCPAELIQSLATINFETCEPELLSRVPTPSDFRESRKILAVEGTVLFADLANSTGLVDTSDWHFSAWIYKAYLDCVSRLIQNSGGVITAFEGDGVMGIFAGEGKEARAARCGLEIQWAVTNLITPILQTTYPGCGYRASQVVGIDSSRLYAMQTKVSASYDLVWIGRAANYAPKLTTIFEPGFSTFITEAVHEKLLEANEVSVCWETRPDQYKGIPIYRLSAELPPGDAFEQVP